MALQFPYFLIVKGSIYGAKGWLETINYVDKIEIYVLWGIAKRKVSCPLMLIWISAVSDSCHYKRAQMYNIFQYTAKHCCPW